jgi:hypothetical protein
MWTEKKIEAYIKKYIKSGERIYGGCSASYIPLTKYTGFKYWTGASRGYPTYSKKEAFDNRELVYMKQERAYRLGLAPRTHKKIDINLNRSKTLFGFVTSSARVIADLDGFEWSCRRKSLPKKTRDFIDNEYDKLEKKAKKHYVDCWDMHDANIGIWRGKLVLIDFSS